MKPHDIAIPRLDRRSRRRVLIGAAVAAAVLLLALANAHLVFVAVSSQPGCVPHPTADGKTPGSYRAAKPAC